MCAEDFLNKIPLFNSESAGVITNILVAIFMPGKWFVILSRYKECLITSLLFHSLSYITDNKVDHQTYKQF